MVKRRRFGIVYQYNENWIGGTYYIQNLIFALKTLGDENKPHLIVLCNSKREYSDLVQLTRYPYIENRPIGPKQNIVLKSINKLSSLLLEKKIFFHTYKDIDIVFPGGFEECFKRDQDFLYWIPDFQEHYLRSFFSEKEIQGRFKVQQHIVETGKHIVFSSNDAQQDFNKFYPDNKLNQYVLPFAVTHQKLEYYLNFVSIEELKSKYSLPEQYFFCSNQFWQHKNHKVILEAASELKKKGIKITIAFSGKQNDYRDSTYFIRLKEVVVQLDLQDNMHFLGFINREDQLLLMKNAMAVIQPSFFEGWSTVIEDAKALNAKIIASSLKVHKEQLQHYEAKRFFDPYQASELAETLLEKIPNGKYNYISGIYEYGRGFLSIVEKINSLSN